MGKWFDTLVVGVLALTFVDAPPSPPGARLGRASIGDAAVFAGSEPLAIRLASYGRGEAVAAAASATPQLVGGEVHLVRGPGVTEWWRALPSALEHGVTIAERPAGDGALELRVSFGDGIRTEVDADGGIAVVAATTGAHLATYARLMVADADGRRMPATMAPAGSLVAIHVDDTRARYPVVVDPLVAVEEALLRAGDGMANDIFGQAVAMNRDGTVVVVGDVQDDTAAGVNAGSARVFSRTGTTWTEAPLLGGANASEGFGISVAVSGDGSRIVVGANNCDAAITDAGCARVYLRSGTAWAEEAVLFPADVQAGDTCGRAVALSDDGTRAIVTSASDDLGATTNRGSAHSFTRVGTTWTEEGVLFPTMNAARSAGEAVAISGSGSVVLLSDAHWEVGTTMNVGAAHAYERTGTTWTYRGLLLAPDGMLGHGLGTRLALSNDGTRALVTAPGDESARVFLRTGTATWAQEAELVGTAGEGFGSSAALSGDGVRAVVGASSADLPVGADAGRVRLFARTGTTWAEDATFSPAAVAASDVFGAVVAIASDGTRAVGTAPGDDTPGGANTGSATVFRVLFTNGTSCGTDATLCASGFCVDGVCCNAACGASSATDCQACSAALTGGAAGTCAPLSVTAAATTMCRPTADPSCDVAEVCSPASTACPTDTFVAIGTPCRASLGDCDPAEACTGVSAGCPADVRATGSVCRMSQGVCDPEETCTGGPTCPADLRASGTVCRAAVGMCDVAESCDGVGVACPGEAFAPPSVACRPSAGPCDVLESCTGTSGVCPADRLLSAGVVCGGATTGSCSTPGTCDGSSPSCPGAAPLPDGTVCRPRDPARFCDVDDVCDGTSMACPDLFAPASTVCGAVGTEPCDAPDHCAGTSSDCVPDFLDGTVCRPAVGACDADEVCSGASASCPPDGFEAAGMTCRSATMACDPEEVCDGSSGECPADVSSCGDAAVPDDAAGGDAGSVGTPDAGAPPIAASGCGCAVGRPRAAELGAWLVLVLALARRSSVGGRRRLGA